MLEVASLTDFQQVTRSRTLAGPVAGRDGLVGVALDLVRGLLPLTKRVRLLGVTLSGFEPGAEAAATQGTLDLEGQGRGRPP